MARWPSRSTAEPGHPAKEDYEYTRNGTANVFLLICPLLGWRHLEVTPRRRYQEFAMLMKALVDEYFPEAEVIRVVLDNLNTHVFGALYETFAPEEARRIATRLEFHYTPKHGSWLNMAELEFSVLTRQCLGRRIETAEELKAEIAAWQTREERGRHQDRLVLPRRRRPEETPLDLSLMTSGGAHYALTKSGAGTLELDGLQHLRRRHDDLRRHGPGDRRLRPRHRHRDRR